jgi:hypothetical protein
MLKTKKAIFASYLSHQLRVVTSRGLLPFFSVDDHVVAVFRKPMALTFAHKVDPEQQVSKF